MFVELLGLRKPKDHEDLAHLTAAEFENRSVGPVLLNRTEDFADLSLNPLIQVSGDLAEPRYLVSVLRRKGATVWEGERRSALGIFLTSDDSDFGGMNSPQVPSRSRRLRTTSGCRFEYGKTKESREVTTIGIPVAMAV